MNGLSSYTEISALNENVTVVQKDGKIYVKKRIPSELTYIYKILKTNHHKNLSDIVELFEFCDCTVVIEKYISGEALSDMLSDKKVLSEKQTKDIIGGICDGLMFLHKHNIIHRDINPNNIIVCDDGQVKIIDFDISRSVKKNAKSDTVILGTKGYAAPEQFGFAQSDIRTDIYAVGVLANVMLTGCLPGKKLYGGRLGRVIKKATAIDSQLRYRSILSFKLAFTGEVDENTPLALKALRRIPGFRTFEGWKMILALILYGTYLPLMALFISWSLKDMVTLSKTLLSELLMFALPFVLLTNLFGIRQRIARRPVTALIISFILSAISFIIGAIIFLPNMA